MLSLIFGVIKGKFDNSNEVMELLFYLYIFYHIYNIMLNNYNVFNKKTFRGVEYMKIYKKIMFLCNVIMSIIFMIPIIILFTNILKFNFDFQEIK